MDDALVSATLVGGGGVAAGLWLISGRTWVPRCILRLPAGHSVYAADVDVENGVIAAGTRSGRIVLIPWSVDNEGHEPREYRSLYQGAPVLSVCLLGRSRLAAADTAGRCLLWALGGDPPVPLMLAGNGRPICSLVRLSEDRLAGLSAGGQLLLWDLAASELAEVVDVPAPPTKLALVRMIHWPAQDVLAFPARGGELVLVDPVSRGTHVLQAHADSFYALISEGEQLQTLGMEEGLWKTWEGLPCRLASQRPCPEGIVSAQGVEGADSPLLIVQEDGSAAVYVGGTDGLELLQRLPGDSFRVAAGPSSAARSAWRRRQRELQAGQLRSEIVASIESGDLAGTDPLLGRLEALGFLGLSLALRARRAERRGDIPAELLVRRRLAGMLDPDDPPAAYSLQRFAELLTATWQLTPARRIYAELQAAGAVEQLPNWLTRAADVLSGEGWIAAPKTPLMPLLEAADVMERPFRGRWLVGSSTPIVFPEANMSASAVAAKYEQVKAERDPTGMPRGREENVWWVSPQEVCRASVVLFPPTEEPSPGLLTPAIRVLRRDLQCVLLPCVLFDAGWPNQEGPPAAHTRHNRALRRALDGCPGAEDAASWPGKLQQTVKLAIRRLGTQSLAPRPE